MEKKLFADLEISKEVKKAVKEIGFEEATAIQTATIPLIMAGKDVIGHSQTGTGKTAAFGIPAIELLEVRNKKNIQSLIVCPTRELAVQASEEIRKFAKYKEGAKIVPVYGGQPIERQIKALKYGANIVVGTPGRIMDLMRRKVLKLGEVKLVVLDEADEMLNMGFKEDVETILLEVPLERQTILFSATMSKEIMRITEEFLKDPELVKIDHQQLTVPTIDQYYFEVPKGRKIDALCNALDVYNPSKSIVFCNTKKQVEELQGELQGRGYMAAGLHGDMRQVSRDQTLRSFKTGKNDILIATDVAARGIDVDDVEIVFNFDLPKDEEYYVHRIGRTGRAGKSGRAYTFVVGRNQLRDIKDLSKYIGRKILLQSIPSNADIHEIKQVELMENIKEVLDSSNNLNKYMNIVEELTGDDFTSMDVALALISLELKDIEKLNKLSDDLHISYEREGGGERDRKSSGRKADSRGKEKMVRFKIDIGRNHGASINVILSGVARATGLPGSLVGKIEVKDSLSYFDIPEDVAPVVLKSMKNYKVKNKVTNTTVYESGKGKGKDKDKERSRKSKGDSKKR
ncbi:MAG: DEAD/DEAH box helicase [Fusobacteria bacterium]|nr:DEAD/DEAH box helicase [Fusobacteriota bacterium]